MTFEIKCNDEVTREFNQGSGADGADCYVTVTCLRCKAEFDVNSDNVESRCRSHVCSKDFKQ